MTDLSRYYPLSGTETINGVFYSWDFIDRSVGLLEYGENHEKLRRKNLNETSEDFKEYIEQKAHLAANGEQGQSDRIKDHSLEILELGDPREFILNTFKTLHIGDNDTAEGLLIGTMNQSIANSKGLQSSVHGESGSGKSHAARAMLHLHPNDYYMITSLTDKALFYMEADELREGMTIFSDDAEISSGLESIIKRSTGFFQEPTEHRVPIKEGGRLTTKKLTIPPRINWLLTSVDSQGDDQFVKRQISYGVDETATQDEAVITFELEKARDGRSEFPVTDDVLICRQIIRHIKEDENAEQRLFTVKIPFTDRIVWLDKKNRRNLPIFLDMIKGYTVLNFKQREKIDGNCLLATETDFESAKRLYNSRGGLQKLHITEREKEMVQHIVEEGGELATDDLMEVMKVSEQRIRQIGTRLTTILPGFSIELRNVNVKDPDDTGKSTTTRRNFYCYRGAVTLELFGSVVSLRDATAEEIEQERSQALAGALEGHSQSSTVRVQEAQNEQVKGKEDHNNNNNLYIIPLEGESHKRIVSSQSSSLCFLEKPASGQDPSQSEGYSKSKSSNDDEEGRNEKPTSALRTPYGGPTSGTSALTVKHLDPDDLLNALTYVGDNYGTHSYETTRALVYTHLTGTERYKQLDGPYFKDTFDFCSDTHPEIANALRKIVREV
jgi:hypothetical protein